MATRGKCYDQTGYETVVVEAEIFQDGKLKKVKYSMVKEYFDELSVDEVIMDVVKNFNQQENTICVNVNINSIISNYDEEEQDAKTKEYEDAISTLKQVLPTLSDNTLTVVKFKDYTRVGRTSTLLKQLTNEELMKKYDNVNCLKSTGIHVVTMQEEKQSIDSINDLLKEIFG